MHTSIVFIVLQKCIVGQHIIHTHWISVVNFWYSIATLNYKLRVCKSIQTVLFTNKLWMLSSHLILHHVVCISLLSLVSYMTRYSPFFLIIEHNDVLWDFWHSIDEVCCLCVNVSLVSYVNTHLFCCDTKRALFTNKQLEHCCEILYCCKRCRWASVFIREYTSSHSCLLWFENSLVYHKLTNHCLNSFDI